MVMVFNLAVMMGCRLGLGEMISWSFRFCNCTNSSKSRMIFLLLKCREESAGMARTNTGGMVSFGPPEGATIWAQREKNSSDSATAAMEITENKGWNLL